MRKTLEEILAPKPETRPCIYAYAIGDPAHAGLLKMGQTPRGVKQRGVSNSRPPISRTTPFRQKARSPGVLVVTFKPAVEDAQVARPQRSVMQ